VPAYCIALEKKIRNFDIFVNGNALANEGDNLERMTMRLGVKPLMSFFSVSPEELSGLAEDHGVDVKATGLQPPEEEWFSAEDGLNTVRKLIDRFERLESSRSKQVISNLKEFERVLNAANQGGVRWHLAIDY
jgi:hypothetical protein